MEKLILTYNQDACNYLGIFFRNNQNIHHYPVDVSFCYKMDWNTSDEMELLKVVTHINHTHHSHFT